MPLQIVLTAFKKKCKVFIREGKGMKVIKYIDAAEIAGVSRQAIYDLKKINIEGKRKYPFFIFDPNTGKAGVNIEDNSWKDYLDRNRNNRVKKKAKVNHTKSVISKVESGNNTANNNQSIINIISSATVAAIKEVIKPDQKTMTKLFKAIDRNLEGKL